MLLSERQKDSLKEVINIAFGRAASSLSELTGHRILIDVPQVEIYAIGDLIPTLEGLIKDEVATVHQIFTGKVAGDALLLLDYKGATALTSLLTDEEVETIDVSAKEVLIEVGNILLNACLGTFGNMLQVHITFSVPRFHLNQLGDMLNTLVIGKEEIRYALLIATEFKIKGSEIGGYLVIVLGVGSLDRLLEAIEKLG
ncbi:MAG: chemotaxis protein CheC [Syntrophorhabdaceae bacterium]|nr:chemotaxis protein CheC [Syntrophorhabdaceae bacterium]